MRQDFVDRLELELRAAGERRARPWRIARRQLLTPALAALGVLAIAVALAATVLRSEDTDSGAARGRGSSPTPAGERGRRRWHRRSAPSGSPTSRPSGSSGSIPAPARSRRASRSAARRGSAAAGGAVWAFGRDRLLRIDPSRNRVVKAIPSPAPEPGLVLEGRGGVWIGNSQALRRIDLRRNAVTRTVPTSRDAFMNIAGVSDGRILYVGRGATGDCCASTPRTGERLSAVPGRRSAGSRRRRRHRLHGAALRRVGRRRGHRPHPLDPRPPRHAVNDGVLDGATVWVQASDRRDRLWRLDARTGHVTGSLALPEFGARGLATVGKQVWTMSIGGDLQVALKKG